ncbi:MAG: DMT family transporter [Halioglobus sp.]
MSARIPAAAFVAATLGIAFFAVMDAVMKALAIEMGAYNAMFWRTGCGVLMVTCLYIWKRPAWPAREVIRLHVWRGVVISLTAFLFFWGLVYVPLAEAIGLSFIAPLMALYLAAVMLGERVDSKSVGASIVGLCGAAIVIVGKLSGDYDEEIGKGIGAILLSAILYAYNLILQRRQALIAEPVEIVFFQTLAIFGAYLLVSPLLAVAPPVSAVPQLALAAVLSIVSMMLVSWAYARAEARTLIPVEYTAFVWAALLGWLFYAEEVTALTLLGTALIVAGCLLTVRQHPGEVDHVETTAI